MCIADICIKIMFLTIHFIGLGRGEEGQVPKIVKCPDLHRSIMSLSPPPWGDGMGIVSNFFS